MAEDGSLPRIFAKLHESRNSPHIATYSVAALAIVMIVSLRNIIAIANLTNFTLLTTFTLINAAVIVLRYREPNVKRPFRVPGRLGKMPVIPVLGILSSLTMLLFVGWKAALIGTALAVSGLVVYEFHGWLQRRQTGARNTTRS
jgi:APA family basic amino acid/polyamine antiporter